MTYHRVARRFHETFASVGLSAQTPQSMGEILNQLLHQVLAHLDQR